MSHEMIYPHLLGSDIGCGMSLWQSDIKVNKAKVERWLGRLSLDRPWEGERESFAREQGLTEWGDALGTVGSGNHFAELQRLEEIQDEAMAASLGLVPERLQLMVHSGSRGLGEATLRAHTDRFGGQGLPDTGEDAQTYLQGHDAALQFARANRCLIARRFLDAIGGAGHPLCEMMHNLVVRTPQGWLHRKGAAPSDQDFVLIPGSRGAFSYIVHPLSNGPEHAYSLAHGAGRRWDRRSARERLRARYTSEALQKTRLGSRVLCQDKDLLYEEAPEAYKNIDIVIQDMVDAGLVKVVAVMRPVLTYKTDGGRKRGKF